jgi:hypothetical protein
MVRLVLALTVAALVACGLAQGTGALTPWQVAKRFEQATGEKLVANRRASYVGHYAALDLGGVTMARRARYGTFTVYVVTGRDVDGEVTELLADGHTGALGAPAAGGIHWERGTTIGGDRYWLAKRRYGANVVLWWIGSQPVRKTDATWARLHRALVRVTST